MYKGFDRIGAWKRSSNPSLQLSRSTDSYAPKSFGSTPCLAHTCGISRKPGESNMLDVGCTEPRTPKFQPTKRCWRLPRESRRAFFAFLLLSAITNSQLNPFDTWVAIERGTWTPRIDFPPVRIFHFSKETFEFGVQVHSVDAGSLRVFTPAKTVADCFKFRSKIGTETAIEALRAACKEKKASMDDLWRAAKVCRVINVIRPYMESLV